MNKLLLIAMLCLPFSAGAEHMDVIQVTLKDNCTVAQYAAIAKDFNSQWGQQNGYTAEIAVPIQSEDLASVFWVGRTADAATFGKAWDTWRDSLGDSGSVASKLSARFEKCAENESRRGYDIY